MVKYPKSLVVATALFNLSNSYGYTYKQKADQTNGL